MHAQQPSSPPGCGEPVHQLNAVLQEAHLVFYILVLCLSFGQAFEGLFQGTQGLGVVLVVINLHLQWGRVKWEERSALRVL